MIDSSEIGSGRSIWTTFLTADVVCMVMYGLAISGHRAGFVGSGWRHVLRGTSLGDLLILLFSVVALSSIGAYLWLHFSRSGPRARHLTWLLLWPAVWTLDLLVLHRYFVMQ